MSNKSEPILVDNKDRFVLFPIEHDDIWKFYKQAEEIGYLLTQSGYGVISGGGPGIMEAANKGANRGGGKSVGLNIALPFEQSANLFIDNDKLLNFDYFFVFVDIRVIYQSKTKCFFAIYRYT